MDTEIDHNLEQITREYVDFLDDTVSSNEPNLCMLSRISNCQLQCTQHLLRIFEHTRNHMHIY